MTEKISLFIIDKDLRIREHGDYEVGDGDKIRIKSGGTENWNPTLGETTFIEKKSWKKYLIFGPRVWKREYYVLRKGASCIDFQTNTVPTPDSDALKRANLNLLARDIGSDAKKGTPWYIWAVLGLNVMMLWLLLNVSGVIR